MPREPEIMPGQTFHLPAAQQKNFENLLKIFSKKEATKALTEMAKVDKSTWQDIQSTVSDLKQISALGGISTILSSFGKTVELQIQDFLSPLTNEINQLMTDALLPIKGLINDIINDLSQFIADNAPGATVGGIVGGVAALFLPGGPILVAIGALIGASIEALFGWLRDLMAGTLPDPFVPNPLPVGPPIVGPDLQVAVFEYYGGDIQAMYRAFRESGFTILADFFVSLRESGVLDEFY